MLLPEIAKLYGKTVDELLGTDDFNAVHEQANNPDTEKPGQNTVVNEKLSGKILSNGKMFLKVNVISQNGDNINVKLPVTLLEPIKGLFENVKINNSATDGIDLSKIDFDMIFKLVDSGVMGEIVNVVSQNGDVIKVYAEREDI